MDTFPLLLLIILTSLYIRVGFNLSCSEHCVCHRDDQRWVRSVIKCSGFTNVTTETSFTSLAAQLKTLSSYGSYTIDLSHNALSNVSVDTLNRSVTGMTELILSNNLLQTLHCGNKSLSLLKTLDLSFNNIVEIPSECFPVLPRLERLDISHNMIKILSAHSFRDAELLYELYVSHNHLHSVSSDALNSLSILKTLDLSGNSISFLETGVLTNKTRLNLLNVSFNIIHRIEANVFTRQLQSLKNVDLSHNSLTTFEPWPYLPPGVDTFNLSNNHITRFSNYLNWTYNPKITNRLVRDNINLRQNNLSSWIGEDLKLYHKQRKYSVYDFVHYGLALEENPWLCDCKFYSFMDEVHQSYLKRFIPEMKCHLPSHLRGQIVVNIPLESFVCNITDRCPNRCFCQKQPSKGYTYVDCSGRILSSFPLVFPEGFIYLDFSRNFLKRLQFEKSMRNIVHINMSHNDISFMDKEMILNMNYLRTLDLTNNNLKHLPQSVSLLVYSSIKLEGNPLVCSCGALWFPDWVRLDKESEADDRLTCIDDSGSWYFVRNVTKELLNCNRDIDIAITISTCLGIFVLGLVTLAVTSFIWRYELKVIVFRLFHLHPRDTIFSDNEETKLYDVYISCDEEDEQVRKWVRESLLAKLEEGKSHYDVFLPFRQMTLGVSKADAIVDAISASSRVIAVLTTGYMEPSSWCQFEFDQAHKIMVEDNHGKCIVVALDEIQKDQVSEEPLKTYLSENRFLNPNDRLFWWKLEYELPVQNKR